MRPYHRLAHLLKASWPNGYKEPEKAKDHRVPLEPAIVAKEVCQATPEDSVSGRRASLTTSSDRTGDPVRRHRELLALEVYVRYIQVIVEVPVPLLDYAHGFIDQ